MLIKVTEWSKEGDFPMMIDQKERNTWIFLTSPFIVMEFCAAYNFNNGNYFKLV